MKIKVTENFVKDSKMIATALLGIGQTGISKMGINSELIRELKSHIKQCDKYLCKLEEKEN